MERIDTGIDGWDKRYGPRADLLSPRMPAMTKGQQAGERIVSAKRLYVPHPIRLRSETHPARARRLAFLVHLCRVVLPYGAGHTPRSPCSRRNPSANRDACR